MQYDDSFPALPEDPSLLVALRALLPLYGRTWTFEDMSRQWDVPQEVADQWEAALIEAGLLAIERDQHYSIPDDVHMALLMQLINSGALEEAQATLQRWRDQAAQRGDLYSMAQVHLWLSNILTIRGYLEGALAELYCLHTLYQAADHQEGVASAAWMIGSTLARHEKLDKALPFLVRAAALAEKLGLEQAPLYRRRLHDISSRLG